MRRRGFTLIELTVVVCIVAVLFGVALDRLLRYQELGERAVLELNLGALNSALTMKFAAYVTSGRPQAIENELGKNPIDLLARPPQNYLGELYGPEVDRLPRPSWYFDRESRELVYLPSRGRHLTSDSGSIDVLRFRIFLTQGRSDPGEPRELPQPFIGQVTPFRWLIE
jgi:prepilin-type N-terminal cleavage/methylation domain-containing protein